MIPACEPDEVTAKTKYYLVILDRVLHVLVEGEGRGMEREGEVNGEGRGSQ